MLPRSGSSFVNTTLSEALKVLESAQADVDQDRAEETNEAHIPPPVIVYRMGDGGYVADWNSPYGGGQGHQGPMHVDMAHLMDKLNKMIMAAIEGSPGFQDDNDVIDHLHRLRPFAHLSRGLSPVLDIALDIWHWTYGSELRNLPGS